MKIKLNAQLLRILLAVACAAVAILCIVAFGIGYSKINEIGQQTQQKVADAEESENTLGNLRELKSILSEKENTVQLVSSLRSSAIFPQFDTEQSIRAIAKKTNVPVDNITFIGASASGGGDSSTQTPTVATPGTRSSQISFEVKRSIEYNDAIRFLQAIETSIPKLTVIQCNINAKQGSTKVDLGEIIIETAVAK